MGDDVHDGNGHSATPARLVLVLGSARSGADSLAQALQLLGLRTPGTDPTSGSAEASWVTDFHERLLHRANVRVSDARPQAWFETGRLATQDGPRQELFDWLGARVARDHGEMVVQDPRLAWFAGLWKAAGLRWGVDLSYAVMLRPAAESIAVKRTGSAHTGETSRAAGWLNQVLHSERATRGSRRAFLHHQDLLDDWTVPLYGLGERFGLSTIHQATAKEIRRVHDLIEPQPARTGTGWTDTDVPKALRIMIDETWDQLTKLARAEDEAADTHATLDQIREEYAQYYAEAERIAHSTILAARRRKPALETTEDGASIAQDALAVPRRRRLGRRPRG